MLVEEGKEENLDEYLDQSLDAEDKVDDLLAQVINVSNEND